jgi:hypothetical protein
LTTSSRPRETVVSSAHRVPSPHPFPIADRSYPHHNSSGPMGALPSGEGRTRTTCRKCPTPTPIRCSTASDALAILPPVGPRAPPFSQPPARVTRHVHAVVEHPGAAEGLGVPRACRQVSALGAPNASASAGPSDLRPRGGGAAPGAAMPGGRREEADGERRGARRLPALLLESRGSPAGVRPAGRAAVS